MVKIANNDPSISLDIKENGKMALMTSLDMIKHCWELAIMQNINIHWK